MQGEVNKEMQVFLDKPVVFSYPGGFNEMAKKLESFPDDGSREMMLNALVLVALWL